MNKRLRNQKGFTLIEIIAVLIILGILAAVAVPKFMNLTADAKTKALNGALAEGMSTCSMGYASAALAGNLDGTVVTDAAAVKAYADVNLPGSDDFVYSFATTGTGVDVTVTGLGTAGSSFTAADTATKTWVLPE